MKLAVVTGTVWATRKAPELEGCRLLLVQPVSAERAPAGASLVAADPGGLGTPGDLVVFVTSTDAAAAFPGGFAPVNASIVELVETVA
jgi:ethanolamine utilization protein EutN